ncbi:MAG: magnesium transporter [Euryarchaeota archaeon]
MRRGLLGALTSMLTVSALLAAWSSYVGSFLARLEAKLEHNPGLAAVLPVLMAATGAAASSVGSSIATHVHLGTVSARRVAYDTVVQGSALILVTLAYTLAVTLTFSGRSSLVTTVLLSATLTYLLAVVVAIVSTFASVMLGFDPDDVVGPVVTTAADSAGILITLLLAPG